MECLLDQDRRNPMRVGASSYWSEGEGTPGGYQERAVHPETNEDNGAEPEGAAGKMSIK